MTTHRFLAFASAGVLALAGCGGGEETAAGGTERYCQLAGELDARGGAAFAGVEEGADPRVVAAIERGFVVGISDDVAELRKVAPAEIESDVRLVVAGMRKRAGLSGPAVEQDALAAAEERVQAFEQRECGR